MSDKEQGTMAIMRDGMKILIGREVRVRAEYQMLIGDLVRRGETAFVELVDVETSEVRASTRTNAPKATKASDVYGFAALARCACGAEIVDYPLGMCARGHVPGDA